MFRVVTSRRGWLSRLLGRRLDAWSAREFRVVVWQEGCRGQVVLAGYTSADGQTSVVLERENAAGELVRIFKSVGNKVGRVRVPGEGT